MVRRIDRPVQSAASLVLAAAAAALLVPAAALAHDGREHGLDAASAAVPSEVDGRCTRTVEVGGLGDACRTDDGLLRVQGEDGESFTTHGADAPAEVRADAYATGSAQAVADAGPGDIECVTAPTGRKHTRLVYSYPVDQPSRYATIAPQLIEEAYKASAFMRAEARSVNPAKGLKLVLECDASGVPVVHEVQLPTAAESDSFSTIVSDLKAKGFGSSYSLEASDRQLVFHDSPVAGGAAGTGHLYRDDRATTANSSNKGGLFAIEYNWSGRPHWYVLLHELAHNMGAVQSSAANATDYGHCNDGHDIMCYADGSPDSAYGTGSCAVEVLDCRRDDYFHPAPPAGSYLATHWNMAHTNNLYLAHSLEQTTQGTTTGGTSTGTTSTTGTNTTTTQPVSDTTAPSRVRRLRARATSATSVRLTWRAASDDIGVDRYEVERHDRAGGRWVPAGMVRGRSIVVRGLAARSRHLFRVAALDAAGNRSRTTAAAAATPRDRIAPARVRGLVKLTRSDTPAAIRWLPTTDNVAVARYLVYRLEHGRWRLVASTGRAVRTVRTPGTGAAAPSAYHVRARDTSGNLSRPSATLRAT